MARRSDSRGKQARAKKSDMTPVVLGGAGIAIVVLVVLASGSGGMPSAPAPPKAAPRRPASVTTDLPTETDPPAAPTPRAGRTLDAGLRSAIEDALAAHDYRAAFALLGEAERDDASAALEAELRDRRRSEVARYLELARVALGRGDRAAATRKLEVALFFDPDNDAVSDLAAKHSIALPPR